MIPQNNFVKDLNALISKYLTREQRDSYMMTMAQTFYANSTQIDTSVELFTKIFNDNLLSERIRFLTDTLVTFSYKEIVIEKHIEFLLEFSKLILDQGENNLSFELASNVLVYCKGNDNYELYKGKGLLIISEYHMRQASWKEAVSSIKSARDIFESNSFNEGLAKCEFLMGSMYVEKGDLKAGKVRLDNCVNYFNPERDPMLMAMVEVHFGIIAYIQGNYQKSLDYYNKALNKFEIIGDSRRKAEVLQNIGMIHMQQKEYSKALEIYEECVAIAKHLGFKPILNLSYINQSEIYLGQNDLEKSFKLAQEAMTLSYQLNDKLSIAELHKILGVISKRKENLFAAEHYLLTSLRLNKDLSQDLNTAETNYELGMLYKSKGDKPQAHSHLLNAYKYYHKNNSKNLSAEIESHLFSLAN